MKCRQKETKGQERLVFESCPRGSKRVLRTDSRLSRMLPGPDAWGKGRSFGRKRRYEVFSLSVIGTYQCDPGPCVNLRAVVASRALKIELMGGKLRLSIPPDYTFVLISTWIRRGLVHISKHIDLRETDPSSQPIRNIRRPLKWNSTRRCQHNENVVR